MKLLLGWRLITLALVLPMFGCASSGIVQTGQNSYMLAKSEWGFTSEMDCEHSSKIRLC
jgi:hypothetical protein